MWQAADQGLNPKFAQTWFIYLDHLQNVSRSFLDHPIHLDFKVLHRGCVVSDEPGQCEDCLNSIFEVGQTQEFGTPSQKRITNMNVYRMTVCIFLQSKIDIDIYFLYDYRWQFRSLTSDYTATTIRCPRCHNNFGLARAVRRLKLRFAWQAWGFRDLWVLRMMFEVSNAQYV